MQLLNKTLIGYLLSYTFSTYAAFPTTWSIVNLDSNTITINCSGIASGLRQMIRLEEVKIGSQQILKNEWKKFHNDGLGLNSAKWKCHVANTDLKFLTNWGEDITLIYNNNKLEIIKNFKEDI